MDFPDHNHFLQLQKDLWQWPSSRAAVMVGAGLSRNARPSPGVVTRFPTWEQLSRSMFDEIYPIPPNETEEQKEEREEKFDRRSAPRVASEYEAEFGPQQLESFLRAKIPNTGHQPGDIHRLLLQLPWKDVFTTNYDTLLERTEIPERAYQPVTTINDLTTAVSPRIIKLHGSFPSQTPFIITEEHYRTYPQCFAPFVNTVRQSLQGYRELRDSSGSSAISRMKRALTDPISPGCRLNLVHFFHRVGEPGRKLKVRDCPDSH